MAFIVIDLLWYIAHHHSSKIVFLMIYGLPDDNGRTEVKESESFNRFDVTAKAIIISMQNLSETQVSS
jgi:hypothetical protein